jgi:adenylate cyclase
MKRLTYISRQTTSLTAVELEELGATAVAHNSQNDITGALIYVRGLFFQIIEGDEAQIDQLYYKIRRDPRHKNVLCLKTEYEVTQRLFPEWSMRIINLDESNSEVMWPIRILLQNVMESQAIINQYTQPTILKILNEGINPLTTPIRKVERIVLFTDIAGFSALTEAQPIDDIIRLLNYYLDVCSRCITAQGGEVTKFIGDSVMAYFALELADQAIQACLDIQATIRADQEARESEVGSLLCELRCGFGLSCGEVLEGNIGSAIKKDYTIIGDAVNMASRLESLTRQLGHEVLFSEEVKSRTTRPWPFISLGSHLLKGKTQPVELFSIS